MKQLPWVLVGLMALWATYCIREGQEGTALALVSFIAAGAAVVLIADGVRQLRR